MDFRLSYTVGRGEGWGVTPVRNISKEFQAQDENEARQKALEIVNGLSDPYEHHYTLQRIVQKEMVEEVPLHFALGKRQYVIKTD